MAALPCNRGVPMRHQWIVGFLALTSLEAAAQQTEAGAEQQPRAERTVQRELSQAGLARALRSGPPAETFSLIEAAPENSGRAATAPSRVRAAQMALFAGEEEGRATLALAFGQQVQLTLSAPWNNDGDTQLADLDG